MIRNGFLALLLIALLGIGLGSVALPEEIAPGAHLYDGDEDDAAIAVPGRTHGYIPHDIIGLPSVSVLPAVEAGRLLVDLRFILVSESPPLRSALTRAPPVH